MNSLLKRKKIHLIAIGGAVMHNLAIALQRQGNEVSGSDDEIYEPSRSRLLGEGLLPDAAGWHPERITSDLNAIILGMHAREDNPELVRAKELGIPIYSFPEYVYQQSKNKKRVAVCGSHGKTTITSMIMHALSKHSKPFDYLVGAQLKGFDCMVSFSDAPVVIIEGDEYFTSPLDRRPKFLHYHPDIAVISGIAWDHFNVFPTYADYTRQFSLLMEDMDRESLLILNREDQSLIDIASNTDTEASQKQYSAFDYRVHDNGCEILFDGTYYPVSVFGRLNVSNLRAASEVCLMLGIPVKEFLHSMVDFEGASKRLEQIPSTKKKTVYRDFAHAPSKVKATVEAVREKHAHSSFTAILELHTFSSLNREFLPQYAGTLDQADQAIVFFNPETLERKKLPALDEGIIKNAFGRDDLIVIRQREELASIIGTTSNDILLMMSSGNFGNLEIEGLI